VARGCHWNDAIRTSARKSPTGDGQIRHPARQGWAPWAGSASSTPGLTAGWTARSPGRPPPGGLFRRDPPGAPPLPAPADQGGHVLGPNVRLHQPRVGGEGAHGGVFSQAAVELRAEQHVRQLALLVSLEQVVEAPELQVIPMHATLIMRHGADGDHPCLGAACSRGSSRCVSRNGARWFTAHCVSKPSAVSVRRKGTRAALLTSPSRWVAPRWRSRSPICAPRRRTWDCSPRSAIRKEAVPCG